MTTNNGATLVYTITDEAPWLATIGWLPVVEAYLTKAGIDVTTSDISLAARTLAACSDILPADQRVADALAELGKLVIRPEAVLIKTPNISASVPQLQATIAELQTAGFKIPDYSPETHARYSGVLGSAVNPVIREGNSDRRSAPPVKADARRNPPRNKPWQPNSRAKVASMSDGDFRANEQSATMPTDTTLRIDFVDANGAATELKSGVKALNGSVVDATFLSVEKLRSFIKTVMADAKQSGLVLSVHLKATMMKVSDPIIFGHILEVYFAEVFEKHADTLKKLNVNPNNGLQSLFDALAKADAGVRTAIEADIRKALENGPALGMVDSARGITNLHAPNLVIVDASMPNVIRDGGCWWNAAGQLQETVAVIPDRSYAALYGETIKNCIKHGALDPKTIGTVSNVGLMAKKAEEYGSHGTTFVAPGNGRIVVKDAEGRQLFEHKVSKGDIWRLCRTEAVAIKDWVRLAVERARLTGAPAVFWLDETRPHDREIIAQVKRYLPTHDTKGLELPIKSVAQATAYTLEVIRSGRDVISATGNVLRDWITDLFPILELGTSSKMLSIVPMLQGGCMFETGAGGSAPKHVQQFAEEGHLRWDSLGEFLALVEALRFISRRDSNKNAMVLADALERALGTFLAENKSPHRDAGQLDNRGSQYFMARYWAEELAAQKDDENIRKQFAKIATDLRDKEKQILSEISTTEHKPVALGGYYRPDVKLAEKAMRPSGTMNGIVASLAG